jgi:hypothetical protein
MSDRVLRFPQRNVDRFVTKEVVQADDEDGGWLAAGILRVNE